MNLSQWVEKIRHGDQRALASALSEVENRGSRSPGLLRALFPFSDKARRLGVTGAPGTGKSTLISQLCSCLRLDGHRVAIIAIDPTSPFTGGSILGDRVRMQLHDGDDGVFIRSMATRGSLGGLASATADVAVEYLGVDTDHQEHAVVDPGDVLGGIAQRVGPAELLEADEIGVLRAQLEE